MNGETVGDAQSGNADWNRNPPVHFEIEQDPARAASIRKLPSKSIAGFAASRRVRQVTFHAEVKAAESSTESGRAEIWADVVSVAGARTLYHLSPVNQNPDDHEPGFGLDVEKDRDISALDVFAATPDKTLPLLVMQLKSHSMGANSGANVTTRHLFDFRTGPPKSRAALDCVEYQAGGACNAYDSLYSQQTDVDCQWIAERNDFLCTHTRRAVRLWGDTAWTEVSYLISGDMRWPAEVEPDSPRTLPEWVDSLAGGSPVGGHTVLPIHGDTHVLWQGHQGTLLASRGETSHHWPKFTLIHGHPQSASELPVRTLEPGQDKPSNDEEPLRGIAPGILAGSPMTFTVKELGGPGGVQFLQVLLTQGDHRSLFWIGIEESHRAEALWIATDAAEYDVCREAHVAASATKAQWLGGSRTLATLDVEPRRFLSSEGEGYLMKNGEQGSNQCPQDVRLSWTSETGWQIAGQARACNGETVTIRAIAISATGEITANPAPIFRQ
ncbi:MAG: hypothetical protein ABI806_02105 [Candidatus Solibacter sp.]